jgi:predicted ribosomally synthesized peptide with SipW-like signal peptide
MKRSILLSTLVIGAVVAVLAVAGTQALFTDSQTASGDVNAGTLDLYLLEPSTADDAGANEIIFEGTENLTPGNFVTYGLRIRNDGNVPFSIAALDFSGSLGAECDAGNAGDEFVPSINGVLVGDVVAAGGVVDTTVRVDMAAGAGNDCQNDIFTVVLDVDVTQ